MLLWFKRRYIYWVGQEAENIINMRIIDDGFEVLSFSEVGIVEIVGLVFWGCLEQLLIFLFAFKKVI